MNTARRSIFASCLAASMLTSCPQSDSVRPVEDKVLIETFFNEHPEIEDLFAKPPLTQKVDFNFDVYVDHSASIQGYLNLKATNSKKDSPTKSAPNLFNLLRQLANRVELLEFNAFGTVGQDSESTKEEITPLGRQAPTTASAYNRLNNDYASLIRKIRSEQRQETDGKPIQHIIITDGVQSHRDPGDGSALSKTVKELQAWIDEGGAVDIRVSVSSYAGKYYSEELRALQRDYAFSGSVPDRPFLIITLLQSPEHLSAWHTFWNSSGLATIPIEALASFPASVPADAGFLMEPEHVVDKSMAPNVLHEKVCEDVHEIISVDHCTRLFAATVKRPRDSKNNALQKYPFCIAVKTNGAGSLESFRSSKPTLQIWRNEFKPSLQDIVEDKNAKKTSVMPAVKWTALSKEEMNGAATDLRETFSSQPSPLAQTEDGLRLLIYAPLQGRGAKDILVITTEQTIQPPQAPDFSKHSCTDDSSPESLNRIYNLQQLVEQFGNSMKPVSRKSSLLVLTHY